MGDEVKEKDLEQVVSGEEEEMDANAYVSAINEMKKNSVSRADYDKVKEENKVLLDAIINGAEYEVEKPEKEQVDIEALKKELFNPDNQFSNLDFAKKALKLRKAIIEEGGADPFLPSGRNIVVEESDITAADKVADVLEQCIDYADGDSEAFTNEFNRRIVADALPKRSKL